MEVGEGHSGVAPLVQRGGGWSAGLQAKPLRDWWRSGRHIAVRYGAMAQGEL